VCCTIHGWQGPYLRLWSCVCSTLFWRCVCVVQYMVGKGLTFDSGGVCVVHCSGGVRVCCTIHGWQGPYLRLWRCVCSTLFWRCACVLYNTWLVRALPSTLEVCVCLCVCVGVCVCVFVCVCVCVCTHTHTLCIHIHTGEFVYVYMQTHTHARARARAHTHTHTHKPHPHSNPPPHAHRLQPQGGPRLDD
jgi:hypothetical protein